MNESDSKDVPPKPSFPSMVCIIHPRFQISKRYLNRDLINYLHPFAGTGATTMTKRRNHHKQAYKAVRDVPVIIKRSLAELRRIAEEEEQARWEEIKLVHEISRWL